MPRLITPHLTTPRHTTPRHITPHHTTQRHATPRHATPHRAALTLKFKLVCALQGKLPQVQAAMDLYHILSESDTHLRQPVALETQLLADEDMDDDVGRSMLQLLQVLCLNSQVA